MIGSLGAMSNVGAPARSSPERAGVEGAGAAAAVAVASVHARRVASVTGARVSRWAAPVAAVPLIGSAAVYAAGGFSTTGRKGNIVEVALGIDATNVTAGSAVATPTLRWSWTEG